jgi:16S rRNA (guanine966-N2)-methyltransferase
MGGDCRRYLAMLKRRGELFDFIYVDPPWGASDVLALQLSVEIPPLLSDDGLLVVESERKKPVLELDDVGLRLMKSCQYGICVLSFYRFLTASDVS